MSKGLTWGAKKAERAAAQCVNTGDGRRQPENWLRERRGGEEMGQGLPCLGAPTSVSSLSEVGGVEAERKKEERPKLSIFQGNPEKRKHYRLRRKDIA